MSGVASVSPARCFSGFFARLMDQRQQYDMFGHGYSGPGTQRYKGVDSVNENWPYYPPERREAYENKPMVSSFANTHHQHHGSHTGRRLLIGEVPIFPPGCEASPLHNPYVATSLETSDKDYGYSGNFSPQAVASGYGPAGWALQDGSHRSNQDCGASDLMQARSGPNSPPGQRYPDPISPYGSNTEWRSTISPTEQMSAAFNDALSFSSPELPTTCANCQNPSYINEVSVCHGDQRDINSTTTDWRFQGTKNYFLRSNEGTLPSNRQVPTQNTRRDAPHNGRLGVPHLEQPKSRFSLRKSAPANVSDNPMLVCANEDDANNGLTKKRKRKPRIVKPRKPRTLTNEGKLHAKAVRESPGGACADCKRKKTKARDPLVTNLVFPHAYNRT